VVASKDLKPDDILVRVPFTAIMRLKWVLRRLASNAAAAAAACRAAACPRA
jgi:hypothetical protein